MTLLGNREEMIEMVDIEKGLVDRRIFSDQDIYQLELERIFARAWNFVAHDSRISNPGDFFMTFIGEDRVIVVRDNDMMPQVLVNTCRHRGNAVCRAEEGHATSSMCTYHGWTYDLEGKLVGMPGFKEVYHEELDRENWGLIKAAQVEHYKGFIFACMDPEAPGLDEYLGETGRMSLDMLAERGGIHVIPEIPKYVIPCNWKLAVDNVWDWYHGGITHFSSMLAGWPRETSGTAVGRFAQQQVVVLGEYGHAISGPATGQNPSGSAPGANFREIWRERPEAKAALGPVGIKASGHPNIFPNMWITQGAQISLRLPKGSSRTEIWWFSMQQEGLSPEASRFSRTFSLHMFGPAGMFEQEDGENWALGTQGAAGTVSQRHPINFPMGLGRGELQENESGPAHIETRFNEHAQLWHYRAWAEWMAAGDWQNLRENHSHVPEGSV